jgi:hypothetical protein
VKDIDVVGHKDKTFKNNLFFNSFKLQYNKAYFPLLSRRRIHGFCHYPNAVGV